MTNNTKIMIVEDEVPLLNIMVENMSMIGYEVKGLTGGERIIDELSSYQPELLVLDQIMPGKSGQDVIREIRSNPIHRTLPIVMVTAIADEEQIIKTLELGADDYLKKPASLKELDARIQAVLRRVKQDKNRGSKNLSYRGLSIDLAAHRVTVDGQEVALTLTEYKILTELIKQVGAVVSRDQLREYALGNLNISDRTIDVHMASLRKKLNALGDSVETVRGVGYRVTA